MEQFRANPPKELAGSPVCCVKDFKLLEQTDAAGAKTPIVMPDRSNVLQWFTENGTKVSVRPSGTEPKIKFYIEVPEAFAGAADYERACAAADKKCEAITKALGL